MSLYFKTKLRHPRRIREIPDYGADGVEKIKGAITSRMQSSSLFERNKVRTRPRIRGQFCRRGKYKAVCLPPAASLLDGPVSLDLQLFLCDKILFGSGACHWRDKCEISTS